MSFELVKVSGQKDPVIRLLRDLGTEEGRRRRGLFFAEGEELVRRAFDYGGRVESLVLAERYCGSPAASDVLERCAASGVPVYTASEGLIAKTLEARPTPECLAIVERRVVQLHDLLARGATLLLMVEHGENADNLGMLLRSTDAAGVDGVVLAADTVDPFGRRVVRGSRGAVFTVPICLHKDVAGAIEGAHKAGMRVVASSARSEVINTLLDYTRPTMLVVGNEHVGITDAVREHADAVVRIPMRGRVNSLNIAVAASILLYEVVRQRG